MGNLIFISVCLFLGILVMARTGDSTPSGSYEIVSGRIAKEKVKVDFKVFWIYFIILFGMTLCFFFYGIHQSHELMYSIAENAELNALDKLILFLITPVFLFYYFIFYVGSLIFLTVITWVLFIMNKDEKRAGFYKAIFICNLLFFGLSLLYISFFFLFTP